MADPFSLAAGIAGLLSLSMELTKAIMVYINGFKGHSNSIKELSEKLGSLNGVLEHLDSFLRTEEMKGTTFSHASTLFFATNAYRKTLESLRGKLEKQTRGTKFSQSLEKFKWPLTEAENSKMIETLHGYLQTFHFSLTIQGCELLSKTSDDVSKTLAQIQKFGELTNEVSERFSAILQTIDTFPNIMQNLSDISHTVMAIDQNLQNREQEKETAEMHRKRKEVLEWLSPLIFKDRHQAVRALRQPGTGIWFLETAEFKEWSGNDRSSVLWCPGIPGAGKTVMTSSIIDHLIETHPTVDFGIAYLYCDYKDSTMQTSINLFSSLVRQLAEKLPVLPSEVETFYKDHTSKNSQSPKVKDYLKLLYSVSRKFKTIFLLVDALDEGPNDNEFKDWKALLSTVQEADPELTIKLLVTSRPLENIVSIFKGWPKITIRADDQDIKDYITSRIRGSSRLAGFVGRDLNLQNKIIGAVSERIDGMFLLARFQMDRLEKQTSPRNVVSALENMPAGYVDIYNDTLFRIQSQCREQAELAIRVLSWIYYARRPLEADELRYALAVQPGDKDLDESGLQDAELLLGVCGGLVSLDKESNTIRLVHYTVQEYFDSTRDQLFPEGEIDILSTCLTHLLFANHKSLFSGLMGWDRIGFLYHTEKISIGPFSNYAIKQWIHHFRGKYESKPNLVDLVVKYIKSEVKNYTAIGDYERNSNRIGIGSIRSIAYRRRQAILDSYKQCCSIVKFEYGVKFFTALHLAAGFGLVSAVRALLKDSETTDIDALDSNVETPLSWAARNGSSEVIQFLVDQGACTWVVYEGWKAECLVEEAIRRNSDNFRGPNPLFVSLDSAPHSYIGIDDLRDRETSPIHAATPFYGTGLSNSSPQLNVLLIPAAAAEEATEHGWRELFSEMRLRNRDHYFIGCKLPATVENCATGHGELLLHLPDEKKISVKLGTRDRDKESPNILVSLMDIRLIEPKPKSQSQKATTSHPQSIRQPQEQSNDKIEVPPTASNATLSNTTISRAPPTVTEPPCKSESTRLLDITQESNPPEPEEITLARVSQGFIRIHYISIALGISFFACLFLFIRF